MTTIAINCRAKRPMLIGDRRWVTTMESSSLSHFAPKIFRSVCGTFAYGADGRHMSESNRISMEMLIKKALETINEFGDITSTLYSLICGANVIVVTRDHVYLLQGSEPARRIETFGFLGTGGRIAVLGLLKTDNLKFISEMVMEIDTLSGTDLPEFDCIYQDELKPLEEK